MQMQILGPPVVNRTIDFTQKGRRQRRERDLAPDRHPTQPHRVSRCRHARTSVHQSKRFHAGNTLRRNQIGEKALHSAFDRRKILANVQHSHGASRQRLRGVAQRQRYRRRGE